MSTARNKRAPEAPVQPEAPVEAPLESTAPAEPEPEPEPEAPPEEPELEPEPERVVDAAEYERAVRAAKAAENELVRELTKVAPADKHRASGVASRVRIHLQGALMAQEPERTRTLKLVAALVRVELEVQRVRGLRLVGAKLEEAVFRAFQRGIARVLPLLLCVLALVVSSCAGPTAINASAIEPAVEQVGEVLERYMAADALRPEAEQVVPAGERAVVVDVLDALRTLIREASAQ